MRIANTKLYVITMVLTEILVSNKCMSLGHISNVANGQTTFDEPSKFVHKPVRTDIEKPEKGSNVK